MSEILRTTLIGYVARRESFYQSSYARGIELGIYGHLTHRERQICRLVLYALLQVDNSNRIVEIHRSQIGRHLDYIGARVDVLNNGRSEVIVQTWQMRNLESSG